MEPPTTDPRGDGGGRLALAPALLLALLASGCVGEAHDPVGRAASPVLYGELEWDEPGTVRIVGGGTSCSGSVVGHSLVMTANHCVDGTEPRDWTVQVGTMPVTDRSLWVSEIVTPGPYVEGANDDIALLVLGSPIDQPIYTPAFELDEHTLYSEVKIVGYGLDEYDRSGTRSSALMGVVRISPLTLRLAGEASPGSGDSGGPAIDHRGQVVGVISRGGSRLGIVTRVDAMRWLLDPYLRLHGGCVPGDPEACDGVDNDCDMEVDEGCLRPGDPCETPDRCTTGLCAQVDGPDPICTRSCDPGASAPCWEGAYCLESSCGAEGLCRPGDPGDLGRGEACDDDLDCRSLLCRDPGDGVGRCSVRCEPDALECDPGEACALLEGGCGACFDAGVVAARVGLGEPCESDGRCRSGLCLDDHPHRYCSETCEGDWACPDAMHCREGLCVRGEVGRIGAPCASDDDCESGLCWASPAGGAPLCAAACGEMRTWCPPRSSCDYDLSVCVPEDTPVGAPCGEADRCAAGECRALGGEALCVLPCDGYCPTGFACAEADDGEPVCWPADPPGPATSCSCAAAGARRPRLPVAAALGALLLGPGYR